MRAATKTTSETDAGNAATASPRIGREIAVEGRTGPRMQSSPLCLQRHPACWEGPEARRQRFRIRKKRPTAKVLTPVGGLEKRLGREMSPQGPIRPRFKIADRDAKTARRI